MATSLAIVAHGYTAESKATEKSLCGQFKVAKPLLTVSFITIIDHIITINHILHNVGETAGLGLAVLISGAPAPAAGRSAPGRG